MNLFSSATVSYCEKATNFVISRPFYAFSNIGYLVTGFLILRDKTKLATYFGAISILVGLASFIYDAKPIILFQLIDLFMMLIFATFLLFLNLKKIVNKKLFFLWLLPLVSIIFVYYVGGRAGQYTFATIILVVMVSEGYLMFNKKRVSRSLFAKTFLLFLFGFIIWLLDSTKTICLSGAWSIFNGRAVFHYTTAVSIYYLYKYYAKQDYKL